MSTNEIALGRTITRSRYSVSNGKPTMSSREKLSSMAKVPAFFVGAFLLAFLAISAGNAFAQAEAGEGSAMPEHGYAPPSDDVPPPHDSKTGIDENTGVGTGHNSQAQGGEHGAGHGAAHGGHHGDASKHFNFFDMGWRGKDAYGGPMGDGKMVDHTTGEVVQGEEPMSAPFIFMILNFVVLFGLLAWKGGPVASKAAADRHDEIKNAIDEATKLRAEAEAKLKEYETRLKDADAEIKAMVEGIRKDAEADKARILENAEKQSAAMKKDAESRIAAEIEKARSTLTREVTDAAAGAAEKILREKLTATDQSKLVSTFITDMGNATNARR